MAANISYRKFKNTIWSLGRVIKKKKCNFHWNCVYIYLRIKILIGVLGRSPSNKVSQFFSGFAEQPIIWMYFCVFFWLRKEGELQTNQKCRMQLNSWFSIYLVKQWTRVLAAFYGWRLFHKFYLYIHSMLYKHKWINPLALFHTCMYTYI